MRTLMFGVVIAATSHAQTLISTYTGSVGDEYGAAVLRTADQNNDGWGDILVGAPGYNSQRGYIRCLSGRFIDDGVGSAVLWTLYPSVNAGSRFGSSIAEVATLTGDIATDYVVGAPGYTALSPSVVSGALFLIDGSTHTVATHLYGESNTRLGESIAAVGDQDGDGKIDVAATAPSVNGSPSKVNVIPGSSFGLSTSLASVPHSSLNSNSSSAFGKTVASGFDLDQDGRFDLAIGSPDFFGNGTVSIVQANTFTTLGNYTGAFAGERMGTSIDGTQDFDSDGVVDFVVGAPNFDSGLGWEAGRAVVLSGAQLRAFTLPFELFDLRLGSQGDMHFGACVRASADLNQDGTADFIVGMPDYYTFPLSTGAAKGGAFIYSGKSGMRMGSLFGATQQHLGNALLGGFEDLDEDGFLDFAVAGSLSDSSTTDCGNLKFYKLFPSSPSTYCSSKTNSLGCLPSMAWTGTASASSGAPFLITCANVINQKNGLLMYSHSPNAGSFQGGTLCLKPPLKRTAPLSPGGSATGTDCTGAFSFDMNARIQSGVDSTLVAGAEIFAQYWARDPTSQSQTSLSNAVRFLINP